MYIAYGGDGNFSGAVSGNYTLNITQDAVNVTGGDVTVVYGENATICVVLNNTRATGNVTIMINGTVFNATLGVNGAVNVTVDVADWASGVYNFNVTYDGDGNFTGFTSPDYLFNVTYATVIISSENVAF